jgi:hypothetical protein
MFGPAIIDRKILKNAISAENLMREFEISEELISRNISEKILFEKYNIDDMRPMPYVKIDHTEVANTPGIRIVEAYRPLTPYPYVRYCFIKEVYDFQNIVFERSEVINFYKIENQFDWIIKAIAEAQDNILADIVSMKNFLVDTQTINSQHDDELKILLKELQESAGKSGLVDDELLTTVRIVEKNTKLKDKIDDISSSINTIIDECLIKLEEKEDLTANKTIKEITRLLKLKRTTFEDDKLYNEFFKIVESIFTQLSNKAKEFSIVAEHKINIIPKEYNENDKLYYDESTKLEKEKNQIIIKKGEFYALFAELTNKRKLRGERVTLDTVENYWRILSCLHKLKGRKHELK